MCLPPLALAVKPLAYVGANYTCHNSQQKIEYFGHAHSPPSHYRAGVGRQADYTIIRQSPQGEQLAQINERLEELDDRSLRSAVMLENQVLPQLQLLYEGQVTLQQTLAPKERVEVLEDDVITLKTVVKSISNRLAALEKAQ